MDHRTSDEDTELATLDTAAERVPYGRAYLELRGRLLQPRLYTINIVGCALLALLVYWFALTPWPQAAFLNGLGVPEGAASGSGIGGVLVNWRLMVVIGSAFAVYMIAMGATLYITLNSHDVLNRLKSERWRRQHTASVVVAAVIIATTVVLAQLHRAGDAGESLRHDPTATQRDVDAATCGADAGIQVLGEVVYVRNGQREVRQGPLFAVQDRAHGVVYLVDPKNGEHLVVPVEGFSSR